MEVILVVDPNNTKIKLLRQAFPKNVMFLDFTRPPGLNGRDTRARWKFGWEHATGDILAATGVLIQWKSSNASTAVELMRTQGVEAVDGIVRRAPDDDSFIGLFRERAFISEFPSFRKDILLTPETMADSSRLPTFVSFFMTHAYFKRAKDSLPTRSDSDGWDDFYTSYSMIHAGGGIYCTNRLVAYMQHGASLRMWKQFASGVSGMRYCLDHPGDKYARKREAQTVLVATVLMLATLSAAVLTAIYGLLGFGLCLYALLVGFVLTGFVNIVTARNWRAFFFPPLTFVQVSIWAFGALYASISDGLDEEFLAIFRRKR